MRADRLRKEVVRRKVALVPHFDGKTKKDKMTGVVGPRGWKDTVLLS